MDVNEPQHTFWTFSKAFFGCRYVAPVEVVGEVAILLIALLFYVVALNFILNAPKIIGEGFPLMKGSALFFTSRSLAIACYCVVRVSAV